MADSTTPKDFKALLDTLTHLYNAEDEKREEVLSSITRHHGSRCEEAVRLLCTLTDTALTIVCVLQMLEEAPVKNLIEVLLSSLMRNTDAGVLKLMIPADGDERAQVHTLLHQLQRKSASRIVDNQKLIASFLQSYPKQSGL